MIQNSGQGQLWLLEEGYKSNKAVLVLAPVPELHRIFRNFNAMLRKLLENTLRQKIGLYTHFHQQNNDKRMDASSFLLMASAHVAASRFAMEKWPG
jgi:hypothetical protein